MSAAGKRVPYWDLLKGLLIFLVVLGHTGTALGDRWLSVIYAFHMPLFVFVSGYFSRRKESLWEGVKKLVILYLIFHTAYLLLDIVLGESLAVARILSPSFAMWYLLSLVFWRTMIHFMPEKWESRPWLLIVVALLLSFTAGFVPVGTQLSFQRTFVFLPFFMGGYLLRKSAVEWPKMVYKHRYLVIAAIILLGLSVVNYLFMPVFYANHPYIGTDEMLMRVLQTVIAATLSISILVLAPNKSGVVSELGKSSLMVYILHPPMVKILKMACAVGGGRNVSIDSFGDKCSGGYIALFG